MKCPFCSKEMKSGGVKVIDSMLNIFNNVVWYPEEELKKKVKKNYVNLKFNAEGYYCDECMKVVSIFDQKIRL